MQKYHSIFALAAGLFSILAVAAPGDSGSESGIDSWIAQEFSRAKSYLQANISPSGTEKGCVVASPSRSAPNYFYHWVRDAALVMDTVQKLGRADLRAQMRAYVAFSRRNQEDPALSGLGEPKFLVTGKAFTGPWGRPQNDGPALRAIALIHFAQREIKAGQADYVKRVLYDGKLPTKSVIKTDLEFVAKHWQDASVDLWEEVSGDHFYTRMVQRRALQLGADFAKSLGDDGAAQYYAEEAAAITSSLAAFWDAGNNRIRPTLNRTGGLDYKRSDLDVAVVLAALHGTEKKGAFSPSDPRVLASAEQLRQKFATLYPVNAGEEGALGTAIGRYPEDVYNGGVSAPNEGNPWFLATLAYAELYTRAAQEKRESGQEGAATELDAKADGYFARVKKHTDASGHLTEQFSRRTGTMQGAADLTWSYAAFIAATRARQTEISSGE